MLQTIWGWQPALYLFLGGMGAGAFIMSAVLYLIDAAQHRRIVCVSMWAATVSLAVGLLLLVSELINPLRGMLMWQSFSNFSSWMTYGAWGAFAAVVVFGLSALLAVAKISNRLSGAWKWYAGNGESLRRVLCIIGIILGAFVAVYTGMLLMSSGGVPLWDTLLLPALFTVSAFDTGVALVEIVAVALAGKEKLGSKAKMLMERSVVVLVVLECVVLVAFLASMLGGDASNEYARTAAVSAGLLYSGTLAPYFWGIVVACGLVLPLAMALAGIFMHKKGSGNGNVLMAIGALGALAGGCELRFLVLAAGLHANLAIATVSSLVM